MCDSATTPDRDGENTPTEELKHSKSDIMEESHSSTNAVREELELEVVNGIDACALAHDLHEALQRGRCETVPVIVLAGLLGGEGKSLLLHPLSQR